MKKSLKNLNVSGGESLFYFLLKFLRAYWMTTSERGFAECDKCCI